jgi:hypothetical protein
MEKESMERCQLFLANVLEQVKAIRDSGVTNMFDRNAVQFWCYHFGFYEAVEWLGEAPSGMFMHMLTETNWAEVDCILTEDLKAKAARSSGIYPDCWDL